MREILFRGKRIDNGEWHCGHYFSTENVHFISEPKSNAITKKVDPDTISEYTGLKDKNSKKIFEGDIVKINGWWDAAGPAGYSRNQCIILWDNETTGYEPFNNYDCDCDVFHSAKDCEVIGNIYDNPELLEDKKDE